jgi:hypothetical protein
MAALLDEEREAGTIKHRRHAATVAPGGKCYIRARKSALEDDIAALNVGANFDEAEIRAPGGELLH